MFSSLSEDLGGLGVLAEASPHLEGPGCKEPASSAKERCEEPLLEGRAEEVEAIWEKFS